MIPDAVYSKTGAWLKPHCYDHLYDEGRGR
jgi:hypothetical protein